MSDAIRHVGFSVLKSLGILLLGCWWMLFGLFTP